MALRMCPQKEGSCGNSSQLFFSDVNVEKNVNISLGPGEVCIYDVRAECGVPSFFPDGQDSWFLNIFSIDYDDGEVQTENFTIPQE